MSKINLYKDTPSIFQKYVTLTTQKQILIDKVCKKIMGTFALNKLKLLDIGCADGIVTIGIIDKLKKIYQLDVSAIETSTELINCFKSKSNYNINFVNQDVESLDELPKSDFILISHVVSYITNLENFIDKIVNSLKNNGMALIVISNDYSDDKKDKNILKKRKSKNTLSNNVKEIMSKKKIKYDVEVVESTIDVSGIENINENGKTIIEFFKHRKIQDISPYEINEIRNIILKIADKNNTIIKREDYIWIENITKE